MSLAGYKLEVPEIMEQISKNADTLVRELEEVSLAGFQEQLFEIMENVYEKLGQVGQKTPHVTGRLISPSSGNDSAMLPTAGSGCHWPAVTDPAGGVT